jgi:hypothetical protein
MSGLYQRVCEYFAYLYRYDWYISAEVNDDSVSEEKILKDYAKILSYFDKSYIKKLCGDIALETIVNYAMDKDIPYFALNLSNDTCLDCGFTEEFNDCCPECGSKHIQQLRRVTGYLTNDYKTAFNYGKQKEVEDRFQHIKLTKGWK